jgi:NADH:ubiquinone oxidoreductase subunit 2 (subunit N)
LLPRISPLLLTLAFFLNTLSILFRLRSNSFILIWFMMEIRMLRFIVILILSQHNLSNTYVVKYFMFQTFRSVALVVSFSNGSTYHDTLIFISIIKLGTAPFHMWFMRVVEKLSFIHIFWLAVPQKIIPLRIIQLITLPSSNFNKVILVRVALASLHIITQLKLLKMLAASSVYITPWIVFSFLHSDLVRWVFFLLYSLTQGLVIRLLFKIKIKADPVSLKRRSLAYYNLVFLMLTIAGFPPSPLFFIKLYVVFYLFTVRIGITALGLMLIASVSIFNYLNMVRVSAVTSVRYRRTIF